MSGARQPVIRLMRRQAALRGLDGADRQAILSLLAEEVRELVPIA